MKRELEEVRKARWIQYQEQTCTLANDHSNVRRTRTRGLRKETDEGRKHSRDTATNRTYGLERLPVSTAGAQILKTRLRVWLAAIYSETYYSFLSYTHAKTCRYAGRANTTDYAKLLSTEAGLRAVTR